MDNVITVREAAKEADVSTQHINRLINQGVLKADKLGYQRIIDRASFDAWMEKRKKQQEEKSTGNV